MYVDDIDETEQDLQILFTLVMHCHHSQVAFNSGSTLGGILLEFHVLLIVEVISMWHFGILLKHQHSAEASSMFLKHFSDRHLKF